MIAITVTDNYQNKQPINSLFGQNTKEDPRENYRVGVWCYKRQICGVISGSKKVN